MQPSAQLANSLSPKPILLTFGNEQLSQEAAYKVLGLNPETTLQVRENQLKALEGNLRAQIQAKTDSTQPQWIKHHNLKDQEVKKLELVRALLLNVRKDMNKQAKIKKGAYDQRMDKAYKQKKKRAKAGAATTSKQNEIVEDQASVKSKKKKAVPAVPLSPILVTTVYFAQHVAVPHFKEDAFRLVSKMAYEVGKAGLHFSKAELSIFAEQAHAIQHEMSEMFAHTLDKPKLLMNIVDGKLSLVFDATKEQFAEICKNCKEHLGIDIQSAPNADMNNANSAAFNQRSTAPTPSPYAAAKPQEEEEPQYTSSIKSPFEIPKLTVKAT